MCVCVYMAQTLIFVLFGPWQRALNAFFNALSEDLSVWASMCVRLCVCVCDCMCEYLLIKQKQS